MNWQRQTSLGKALTLLNYIGESEDSAGVSMADLMRLTGISRTTASRFLGELQEFGLVTPDANGPKWQLGPKIIALAEMAGNWRILRRRAREAMEEFVRNVEYTMHLGIVDNHEVVYIDKVENMRNPTISSVIGQRRPLNVTALGKCLVAFCPDPNFAKEVAGLGLTARTCRSITASEAWFAELKRIRMAGVAFDDEECDIGARCVAAPVRDPQGYVMAAISVSMLKSQIDDLEHERLTDAVRSLAARVSLNGSNTTGAAR